MAMEALRKPHGICFPSPAQGHITPMMYLAKLLHSRGFHITFINTEFNHQCLLRAGAMDPTVEIEGFQFEAIPDGLPPSIGNRMLHLEELVESITKTCLAPLRQLVLRLNDDPRGGPPVTCMFRDVFANFAQPIADEFGIPDVVLWTMPGCSVTGFLHLEELIDRAYTPIKDASYFSNGYLNTEVDWIPAMPAISLRDLPTFLRTTNPDDIMLNFCKMSLQSSLKASVLIIDTFEELDHEIINATRDKFRLPQTYTIGPLFGLCDQTSGTKLNFIGSNLLKEEAECMDWLDKRSPCSVIYVNFGSITVLTKEQLNEFAWGLANSNHPFMWVIRTDLVPGGSPVLELEFVEKTKERSIFASWCPQKQVLAHPAVGGFLTHSGWNSISESIYYGVPMLCWPFFADQQMNCRFACDFWGIGMEIDHNLSRKKLQDAIKELLEGDKGKEMKKKAMKWKECSRKATSVGGSSYNNFCKVVNDVLAI